MADTEKALTSREFEAVQKAGDALREVVGENRQPQSKLDEVTEEYRTLFEAMKASHAPEGGHGPSSAVCRSLESAQKWFGGGLPSKAPSLSGTGGT